MLDRILIVEDDRIIAEDLREILSAKGYQVTGIASSGAETIREAERNPFDLALMDIRIKGEIDGTETACILRERFDIPVVFLTAYADKETLSHAKRSKPLGFLVKPFQEIELQATVEIALHNQQHNRKLNRPHLIELSENGGNAVLFGDFHIIVASEAMKQKFVFALRVARSEASTILLEGETGTGKDVMAQFIHYSSTKHSGPFVPVNCSAIPETLLESELFGHEQGAFSDARSQKKGLFEIANGGTHFLDEIGELSMAVQTKLLRVLETQSFRRLGSVEIRRVNVRVIAATNRYLADAVQAGLFRLDLFHRLNVIQITVPPLRDREQDILPLANHFVREYKLKYNPSIQGISPAAADVLINHEWPGNVRELRNVLERAMLIEDTNWVQPLSLQFAAAQVHGIAPSDRELPHSDANDMSLKTSERNLILRALEKSGGNQTKAAALLGISRDVLRYRTKKLNLSAKPRGSSASA